jgi:glycerol-3-phosphate acyltransferase PlsX
VKIGIDIMGGDYAPEAILKGAILARTKLDAEDRLFLFGNEDQMKKRIAELNSNPADFVLIDSKDVIEMGDDPVKSFKEKQDASLVKGFLYLKNDLIDGFASAGNTGSMLVGATTVIGVVDGIIRPCISCYYPNKSGKNSLILDVGINADAKPEVLYQYALVGNLYAKHIMGIENPKVGLLNIGSEESKGNTNTKLTYQLMKGTKDFNFIGNVEGIDLYKDDIVDVIITDGFTGNIVLKHTESFYEIVKERHISDAYFDNYNYENYGGTPVLGINKTVVVGHGVSNEIAICNMILLTKEIGKSKLSEKITKLFSYGTS